MKVKIEPASWAKVFALIAKLVHFARGGFTEEEKVELIADLVDLVGIVATDIKEDLDGEG